MATSQRPATPPPRHPAIVQAMMDALYGVTDEVAVITAVMSELLSQAKRGLPADFQWADMPVAVDNADEQNAIVTAREREAATKSTRLSLLVGKRDRLYYAVRSLRRAIVRCNSLMPAIGSYVTHCGEPPGDSWTTSVCAELGVVGGITHSVLPGVSVEVINGLNEARRKILASSEALRKVGPGAIRILSVHEALALLDGRECPVDVLAFEYDLDLLQVLDRDGLIEVRYWTWGRDENSRPVKQPSAWFSPLRYPGMSGSWHQIYVNTERSDHAIPCDVRLSGLGKAELAGWRRQNGGFVLPKPNSAPTRAKATRESMTVEKLREELLGMRQRGEPYTSTQKLADLWGCAKSTVSQAINGSPALQQWAGTTQRGHQARPAATITPAMAESIAAPVPRREASLSSEQEQAVLARLLDQATPEQRAEIHAMTDEGRTALAEQMVAQQLDAEPSPLEPDTPGHRPLKVIIHKRA